MQNGVAPETTKSGQDIFNNKNSGSGCAPLQPTRDAWACVVGTTYYCARRNIVARCALDIYSLRSSNDIQPLRTSDWPIRHIFAAFQRGNLNPHSPNPIYPWVVTLQHYFLKDNLEWEHGLIPCEISHSFQFIMFGGKYYLWYEPIPPNFEVILNM
jgi:hypothetical protein